MTDKPVTVILIEKRWSNSPEGPWSDPLPTESQTLGPSCVEELDWGAALQHPIYLNWYQARGVAYSQRSPMQERIAELEQKLEHERQISAMLSEWHKNLVTLVSCPECKAEADRPCWGTAGTNAFHAARLDALIALPEELATLRVQLAQYERVVEAAKAWRAADEDVTVSGVGALLDALASAVDDLATANPPAIPESPDGC